MFTCTCLTTLCLQDALPPLHNENDIMALNLGQAAAYLIGYGDPVPHYLVARQRVIRVQIGCSVEA
jgi:hypothetical protein